MKGQDKFKAENIFTLDEAIEKKQVILHETGDVNELLVQNISDDPVYIQSGDIVKGGKQDRVIQYDLVVQPKSGKVPIGSFCVEQSRWSQRGNETVGAFHTSSKQLVSKKLKLAAKSNRSQQEVWQEVEQVQNKLEKKLGKSVKNDRSATSLQLTLEDEEIKSKSKNYIKYFSDALKDQQSVIGYIFAINGEINSADLYGNRNLFKKLWPKLLESCAVEAISENDDSESITEVTSSQVVNWLEEVEKGSDSEQVISDHTKIRIKESDKNMI